MEQKDELNARATNDLRARNAEPWGAICFSRRWDSIPMWSYYAKEHRGMVIEFNENDLEFQKLFRARTRIAYGTRGVVRGKSKGKARAVFRKAPEWKHEQEERVMFPFALCSTGAHRIHLASYPIRSLVCLYLGCRIDPCLRAYILDHLSAWKLPHLRVIQLHPETKRFGFIREHLRG